MRATTSTDAMVVVTGLLLLAGACGEDSVGLEKLDGEAEEASMDDGVSEDEPSADPPGPGNDEEPSDPTPAAHCEVPEGALDAPRSCWSMEPVYAERFEPQVQWTFEDDECGRGGSRITGGLVVANLSDDDGDGVVDLCDTPDVAFTCAQDGTVGLRVLDGATGELRLTLRRTPEGQTWDHYWDPKLAVADLDGDRSAEMVMSYVRATEQEPPLHQRVVEVLRADGTPLWSTAHVEPRDGFGRQTSIADLDGDGRLEILAGNNVLDDEGQLLWSVTTPYWSWPQKLAADLDGDGDLEVVIGPGVYDHRGELLFELGESSVESTGYAERGWSVAAADLDEDGSVELLVSVVRLVGDVDFDHEMGWEHHLLAYGADGELRSSVELGSHPEQRYFDEGIESDGGISVADVDGDGDVEALVGTSRMGVAIVDFAGADALQVDSSMVHPDPGEREYDGEGAVTSFDFLGRGDSQILRTAHEGLAVFGLSGELLFELEGPADAWYRGSEPVVADIDDDGSAEILMKTHREGHYGTRVVAMSDANDAWVGARRLWNQHGYRATHLREDGSHPSDGTPSWPTQGTYRTQAPVVPSVCMPDPEG